MKHNPVDILFRDKQGHIAVVQMPNVPLCVWGVTALGARFLPGMGWKHASGLAAAIALVIWAALEIYSGASLFRRLLGAGVLLAMLVSRL